MPLWRNLGQLLFAKLLQFIEVLGHLCVHSFLQSSFSLLIGLNLVWTLTGTLQQLDSLLFLPFCFRFTGVFGIITLTVYMLHLIFTNCGTVHHSSISQFDFVCAIHFCRYLVVQIQFSNPSLCCRVLFKIQRLSPGNPSKRASLVQSFSLDTFINLNILIEPCRVYDVDLFSSFFEHCTV